MLCPEEPDVLIDKDLLDFLLKDDAPCPEILEKENGLLEDWSTPEPEVSFLGGVAAGLWFRRFGSLLSKSFFLCSSWSRRWMSSSASC